MENISSIMTNKQIIPLFLPIKEAAAFTHMSQFFIRKGVKTGKIKHMRSGNKIYIHIPALLETLDTMCGVNSKKTQ